MSEKLIVTATHLQELGWCLVPGSRTWFESHGFDWREFIHNGIEAERLAATGDGFALRAVAHAQAQQEKNT